MANGEKIQRDRIYSLIVGKGEEAKEINNLQIVFKVTKTSSNKDRKSSAYVEIYNLSKSTRKMLEKPYTQVSLKVGYASTGLVQLFQGQVVNITTARVKPFLSKKQGADIITRLDIDELYEALNTKFVSKTIPEGGTVEDAIRYTVSTMDGVESVVITSENVKKKFPDGYPLDGTPRQNLDTLSTNYDLEWQVDGGVIYIADYDDSHTKDKATVPLISSRSGLIEYPEYINEEAKRYSRQVKGKTAKYTAPKKNSLKVTILLNAAIVAGSTVKLQFEDIDTYFKVDEVIHSGNFRGNDWKSVLTLTEAL